MSDEEVGTNPRVRGRRGRSNPLDRAIARICEGYRRYRPMLELPIQGGQDDNVNQLPAEQLGKVLRRILEGSEQAVGNNRNRTDPWRDDRGGVVAAPSGWPGTSGTGIGSSSAYPTRPTPIEVSSGVGLNVWPNGAPSACCPILVVALSRQRDVVEGVSYSLRHVLDYCPNITRAVVYLSEYWDRGVWSAYREAFAQVHRVGPSLRVVLQFQDDDERDLHLPKS